MSQLYPPLKGLLGQEVESVEGIQRKKGLSVRIDDNYSGEDVGGFLMGERDNSIYEGGDEDQLYGKMWGVLWRNGVIGYSKGDGMTHGEGKEGPRPISNLDVCENFAWRSYVADIIVAYGTGCWEKIANRGGDRSHANG